ncbi:hypothetical protein QFZ76_009504 [Streptomyces sp. V4I2]|nr:hypothetical protein [Streptomyces sp. V4I2]
MGFSIRSGATSDTLPINVVSPTRKARLVMESLSRFGAVRSITPW